MSRKAFSEVRSTNTTFHWYKLDRDLESALKYFKINQSEIKICDVKKSKSPYKFDHIFQSDIKVNNQGIWFNFISILAENITSSEKKKVINNSNIISLKTGKYIGDKYNLSPSAQSSKTKQKIQKISKIISETWESIQKEVVHWNTNKYVSPGKNKPKNISKESRSFVNRDINDNQKLPPKGKNSLF